MPGITFIRYTQITDIHEYINQGRIQGGGGGAPGARPPPPPLKLEKNMIFWRKIVIFHTKYPKNVRASLCNWKEYDFLA